MRRSRYLPLVLALLGVVALTWGPQPTPSDEPAPLEFVSEPEEQVIQLVLQIGVNRLSIPWGPEELDPASLELTCVTAPGEVEFLGMELERGAGELTWRVFSDTAGEGSFRLAYVVFD